MATKEPKIHPFNRRGVLIGYVVDCGKQTNGKRLKKFIKTLSEAQEYQRLHRQEVVPEATVLFDRKNEILRCYEKLKEADGATLEEAIDFYLRHGAIKGNPTLNDVFSELMKVKKAIGVKMSYQVSMAKKFTKFSKFIDRHTRIKDITSEQIFKYVFVENAGVSNVTKNGYLRNLSVLFRFAVEKRYLAMNPLDAIKKVKEPAGKALLLSPDDMFTLLNKCLTNEWNERLTVFVMVGFCGIRTEEASKLTWKDINLKTKVVTVSSTVAKDWAHRENPIPDNALKWLLAIEDKRRTGPIIGSNFVTLLRSAVKSAKINHTHNCIRHSFASYSLKVGKQRDDVAKWMGHDDNKVMARFYRSLPEEEVAKKWWAIVPI